MNHVVCEYDGTPHLCISRFVAEGKLGQHNDILNSSYDVVRYAYPTGMHDGWEIVKDLHEFIVRPGPAGSQSALQSAHINHELNETYDFARCGLQIKWLKSSVLQEVTLDGENEVVFQWSAFDHIPLDESVDCGGADGNWQDGQSKQTAFDHFHMNSFDKDTHGDYYISARHRSSIYKISGVDGSVIWRLGHNVSDFTHVSEVAGAPFDFSYQHHLRLQPNYPGYDVDRGMVAISLFDNANDRYDYSTKSSNYSSGKVFMIDEHNMVATMKEDWPLYHDSHELATNQGSFQLLPNGNRIVGGGNIQEVVEWQPGKLNPVFRAHFGDWEDDEGGIGHKINSYRNMRFEWQGYPRWRPAVFAFAPNCGSLMRVYVSWNGATEVTGWEIYGANSAEGPFEVIGTTGRTGFESSVQTPFAQFVYAVALAGPNGDVMADDNAKSNVTQTSVLNEDRELRDQCDANRCQTGFQYDLHATRNCMAPDVFGAVAEGDDFDEWDAQEWQDDEQDDFDFGADFEPTFVDQSQVEYSHCDPCFGPFRKFIDTVFRDR